MSPRFSITGSHDVETVLITAGASAPEQVVQECIEYLETNFGATIREETVRKESVHFPLPKSLRQLLAAGIDRGRASDDFDEAHAKPSRPTPRPAGLE